MIKLIIFDVDGTLAQAYTLDLLPGVADFFRLLGAGGCPDAPHIALATNQGGVSLRLWMERDGYGQPAGYPTEDQVADRLGRLAAQLGLAGLPVYVSYAYQDRRGQWAPTPPDRAGDPRWQPGWRKPAPGMLHQAMQDAGAAPAQTLYVGDRDEDRGAARAAGCSFMPADDFFNQPWSDCAALGSLIGRD